MRYVLVTIVGLGCSPPSAPLELPLAEPVVSERSASAPPPPSASAAVSVSSAPSAAESSSAVHTGAALATPIDGVLPEKPTPAELKAALTAAIVKKGGTTTKQGTKIGTDCVKPASHANAVNGSVADDRPMQDNIDLDGDGTNDQVFSDAAGMTVTYDLYVMRGTCGHPVGHVVISGGLEGTDRFKGGMRVLASRSGCPMDCCPSFTEYELLWEGARYAVSKRAGKRDC